MSTIPEPLYDRLATATITQEDGAALIGLLETISDCGWASVQDAYDELLRQVAR